MKNEMVSTQIYKKRKIFIVKEKQYRKKSKTLSSPTNRARRNTEPVLSELARLKRTLRLNSESISLQRNQVPPYPSQMQRQRATSIPSSYSQYPTHHHFSYGHSGSFDQMNTTPNPNNPIYSSYHHQPPMQNSGNNIINPSNVGGNTYPNHLAHQSSSSSSSTHLTSSSLTSPTQSSGAVYANQRNIQQSQQPYTNPQAQGGYKNYANSSTTTPAPYQTNGQQQNVQSNPQGQVGVCENNQANKHNNVNSPYVKTTKSSTNSMSSSTNAPYSNSSQTDCTNPVYHDKQQAAYYSQIPTMQKSNSWCAVEQRYPDQQNLFNEPQFYHAQSSVPSYGNQSDPYNKYGPQYGQPSRDQTGQINYSAAYKSASYAKGVPQYNNTNSNNTNNTYSYPYATGAESQQIQNTPSTIASRTSQSPHNGGMIDSFEHGQNLYRSQSENIEQELQDFFIDSKQQGNEPCDDDLYNRSNIPNQNNNYYKEDLYYNNNCFNDDTDMQNYLSNPFNNTSGNNYQSSTNASNYFQSTEYGQFSEYQ